MPAFARWSPTCDGEVPSATLQSLTAGICFSRFGFGRRIQNAGHVAGRLAEAIPSHRLLLNVRLPLPSSVTVQMLS